MRCPRCSGLAPEGSRFCPSCGSTLMTTAVVPPGEAPTIAAPAAGMTHTHLAAALSAPITVDYAPGTLLANRYRIDHMLGRGGMGIVFRAEDLRLAHSVALKFLPAALARDPRRLQQFHDEVRLARQISHPNVCGVYDIGDVDGHLFLSMEYVEGQNLIELLRTRGPLSEREAVDIARQICAGLAAVHARGVLHRDLKPANVMITPDGVARLMDFGIAVSGASDAGERTIEGTPAYMAPEQLTDRQVSVRSDLYALGLTLYELFTGDRLFEARSIEELTTRQAAVRAEVPPALVRVSPRLRDVVLQCLDPDPGKRPASAEAVAGQLQIVLLDVETRTRRILQVITQASLIPCLMLGSLLVLTGGLFTALGMLFLVSCTVLVVHEWRNPLGWDVTYKGHRIRFRNHPLLGERLYIDGALADRGRFGFDVTLRGTIEEGAGAGERITAHVRAPLTRLACRIVADAFTPTSR